MSPPPLLSLTCPSVIKRIFPRDANTKQLPQPLQQRTVALTHVVQRPLKANEGGKVYGQRISVRVRIRVILAHLIKGVWDVIGT